MKRALIIFIAIALCSCKEETKETKQIGGAA